MKKSNEKTEQQVMTLSDSYATSDRIVKLTESVLMDEHVASNNKETMELTLSMGSMMGNCALAVFHLVRELSPEDGLDVHNQIQDVLNMLNDMSVDMMEKIANYHGIKLHSDQVSADKIGMAFVCMRDDATKGNSDEMPEPSDDANRRFTASFNNYVNPSADVHTST